MSRKLCSHNVIPGMAADIRCKLESVKRVRNIIWVLCLLLSACGITMIVMANYRGKFEPGLAGIRGSEPRHPVTPEMEKAVAKLDRKIAKFYKLPNTDGKTSIIGGEGDKPMFVYFVKKGCPCSFDAEPLMHKLFKHLEGKVEFVSITDASSADAAKWKKDLHTPYAVISDPKLETMKAYEATASVYSTLIDRHGMIVKRWAGYSKEYLLEMNELMSKLAGEEPKPFDTLHAPLERTSGCEYETKSE